MSIVSVSALAFSMSADAFAVALGKGSKLRKPRLSEALRIGAVFGAVEGITPVIGWLLGLAASRYIQAIDHWVAFGILGAVGLKMLHESFHPHEEEKARKRPGLGMLVMTAVGTSIDAMAVGITFALIDANIWLMAAAIGSATFLMATVGIMVGHYAGLRLGIWAERLGGLVLIGMGSHILYTHLAAA